MTLIEMIGSRKKITGREVKACGDEYWYFTSGGILLDDNNSPVCFSEQRLLATDYEFYEEGIKPEAGELWNHEGRKYWMTQFNNDALMYAINPVGEKLTVGVGGSYEQFKEIIHGQDGWKRIDPPVQDPDTERVEITSTIPEKGRFIAIWNHNGKIWSDTVEYDCYGNLVYYIDDENWSDWSIDSLALESAIFITSIEYKKEGKG
jgi:hypothetical protein